MGIVQADRKHLLAQHKKRAKRRLVKFQAVISACQAVLASSHILSYRAPPVPQHTSILTGNAWVNELKGGHPGRMEASFGCRPGVFERLAFRRVLQAVVTSPFYTAYIRLPSAAYPIPLEIATSPKRHPFFDGALGALDGTHVVASLESEADAKRYRNHKGFLSQNVLAACSFGSLFLYLRSGWEGSAHDSRVLDDARQDDFVIPDGRYYLADAGYPIARGILPPYRGVRYHLQEWASTKDQLPANAKELFNLRHASLRNAVERIFGVTQEMFKVLVTPMAYRYSVQAQIPPAAAALYNFFQLHDPARMAREWDDPATGNPRDTARAIANFVLLHGVEAVPVALEPAETRRSAKSRQEVEVMEQERNQIASAMWESYTKEKERRGAVGMREAQAGDIASLMPLVRRL